MGGGNDSTISVSIEGDCTVGYVYGGGYRGRIGSDEYPINSISINISGGRVLGDVFGGGRGGLDKVCHEKDGTFRWGDSQSDTTGHSTVFCDSINITISKKARVVGNIYGGGESTPYITAYDGIGTLDGKDLKGNVGGESYIPLASVNAKTITIKVMGDSVVSGSIFGAGKGIDLEEKYDGRHSSAYVFAMADGKNIVRIPWIKGTGGAGTTVPDDVNHDDYASVESDITIDVNGTIEKSIYGGGAFSKTYGTEKTISIKMTGGIVKESIFGGGKGSSENINAGFVDVRGISINLTGGNVLKSVYGGGELAQTKTSAQANTGSGINVIINGCEVASNVFGGGLGSSGSVSTKSKRTVTLKGGKVIGSIFGSSSLGNDGTKNETEKFDSFVVIEGGEVGGSVYGGGFKGETHGNTGITITGGTILYSVYGGADVGDVNPENPVFNKELVTGSSTITVNGENDIFIGRSIFGSGNSCLVKGQKNVTISNVTLTSMDSIQNVDILSIDDSTIHLSGRSDATTSQASTKYSLNNIGQIILEKNVVLGLKSPTNEIGKYTSNGGTLSSPSNKLVLYGGLPLSVLRNQQYGTVSGYTILQTDNGKYGGAFAYGSKESTGTFVILKDGNYVESLTRDYSNPECRCWYIAGNVTYVTTIVADGKKANDSDTFVKYPNKIVGIPIQNTDSQLVYTGFDKKVPVNDRFNLVESVKDYPDFSMKVYGDGGSVTNNGIQLSNEVASIGNEYASYVMSVPNKLPSATIELTSSTNLTYTGLVATITIHLKEMREDNGTYHVVNSIDIIVNIHTEATSFPMDDPYDVVIGTRNGKGEAEFIIKRSYQGYAASIESIEGADTFSKITMESYLNTEGTLGWATPLSGKMPMSMISAGGVIGELTGSFSATIKFTSNCDAGNIPVSVAEVKIKLSNGIDADTKYFMLKISVRELESHRVTFVNMDEGLKNEVKTVVSVYSGERILESQKPHTWDHFIDWYSDIGRNNLFDFTSPITSDTIIYSSYKYTVHFDDGHGSGWTTYVKIPTDGTNATVKKPKDPMHPPYMFNGWVDANNDQKFSSGSEIITSDITFYAQWKGNLIKVELVVKEGDTDLYRIEGEVEYGKTYSELKFNDDGSFDGVTAHVKEKYGYKGKFVRWAYYVDDGVAIGVYGDMVTLSNENHTLHAEFTDNAIVVKLVGREPEDYKKTKDDNTDGKIYWYGDWEKLIKIQAPTEMIVFKKTDGSCTFKLGNASFTGYKLSHWSFNLNGRPYEINPAETVQLTQGELLDVTEIEINPVWKHIKYKFKIEDPRGGSIVANKTTNGVVPIENGTAKLYHGDKVSIKYEESGGYTFSRWGQIGSSIFESINSKETTMTIGGDTTLYVVLGGLYDATVKLKVNGNYDNSQTLQLKANKTTNAYGLVSIGDGKYIHSEVKFGTYSVQIKCRGGSWLDVAEYTIVGSNSLCEIELYTIDIKVNGIGGKVTYPEFSAKGREITIDISEGFKANIIEKIPSNLSISGTPYKFTMPSERVELTLTVSYVEYTLTFDANGGSYNGGTTIPSSTISHFGKYDTEDIEKKLTLTGEYKIDGWIVSVNDKEYVVHHGDDIVVHSDHTLKANWKKNGNANYTICVYQMNPDGSYGEPEKTIKNDTIGKLITIEPTEIPGFNIITPPENLTGTITADNNLVFEIRYERQKYTVNFTIHYPMFSYDSGDDPFYSDDSQTIHEIFYGKPIDEINYYVSPGFEIIRVNSDNGDEITTIPSSAGVVNLHVVTVYETYRIVYALGGGVVDNPLSHYTISHYDRVIPEPTLEGYKFIGWSGIGDGTTKVIPALHTGDLNLAAVYDKLPIVTVINTISEASISIDGVPIMDGMLTLDEPNKTIILRYHNEPEVVYKWVINGNAEEPRPDGSLEYTVSSDISVFVIPKIRDLSTPREVLGAVFTFIQSPDGNYSLPFQSTTIYEIGKIDLTKYGFTNASISFENDVVNIVGLEGVTGSLYIKESIKTYDVEIEIHIISNIFDSKFGDVSIMTFNYGRSSALDQQTISNYALLLEEGEVIE